MDREEALRLAQRVQSQPKECFKNSALALFATEEPMVYVEGLVGILGGIVLIDHGWLQAGERIIDVTLGDEEAEHYHPIFTYTKAQVNQAVGRRETFPLYMGDRSSIWHWRNVEMKLYGLMAKETMDEGKA